MPAARYARYVPALAPARQGRDAPCSGWVTWRWICWRRERAADAGLPGGGVEPGTPKPHCQLGEARQGGRPALNALLPGEFTWQMSKWPTPPPPLRGHPAAGFALQNQKVTASARRGQKNAQKPPAGTLLALLALSIGRSAGAGAATAEQLPAVGPGLGLQHGLRGHRREEFGVRQERLVLLPSPGLVSCLRLVYSQEILSSVWE